MGDFSDTENFINQSNLQSKTGYHIGIYSDFRIPFFNLRQELDYSKNISSFNEVKVEIYKKYNLKDSIQAHKDLEGRKILGPAIITP